MKWIVVIHEMNVTPLESGIPWGIHLTLCMLFFSLGVSVLAWFNVASIFTYVGCLALVRGRYRRYTMSLTWLEVFLHTLTFGLYPCGGADNLDACITRADDALRRGKRRGKNQVAIALVGPA